MGIVIILLFSIASLLYVGVNAYYGVRQDDDEIHVWLATLLELPSNHPLLFVRRPWRREFLQFARYKDKNGDRAVVMSLPVVDWSAKYREELIQALERTKVDYEIQPKGNIEFLDVMFGQDIKLAQEVSKEILRNVFKFNPKLKFRFCLRQ